MSPSSVDVQLDDAFIQQLWRDCDGQVSRSQIRRLASEIAIEFQSATITTFIPIFIRRRLRELLADGSFMEIN